MSCATNCGACLSCALSQQGLQSQNSLHQQSLGQAQGLAQQGQQYLNQAQSAQQNQAVGQYMAQPAAIGVTGCWDVDDENVFPSLYNDFSSLKDPEFTDCQCVEKYMEAQEELEKKFLKLTAKNRPNIDKRFLKSFNAWKTFL